MTKWKDYKKVIERLEENCELMFKQEVERQKAESEIADFFMQIPKSYFESLSKEEKAHTVYMMSQMRSGRINLVGDDMCNTWNKLNDYMTSHENNRCRFEDSIYYEMVKGIVELTGFA